jgi:hypothetical protein
MTSLVAWTARTPYSLLVTLVSALLSVALTWPLALTLSTESIGSPHGDGLKHLWTLWWIRAEVMAKGAIPFQTQLVNYPEGMALYPIEPLNGLLVVLLAPLSVVTVSNLAALANLTLIGVCGALLGRRVSGEPLGGLAAGVLLQTSAVALFTLHVGVGELQHLWWLPLGLLAWLNHKETQSFKSAVWLGLSLGLAALSCFYHGFFLGFSVAVLSLFTLPLRGSLPGVLLRYAVAAGLGLALVLPVMRTFSSSYGEDERPSVGLLAYITQEHGQPVTDPSSARLDPLDLVSPRRDERATASPERMGYGGGRYLGLPALALGLLALWRSPRQAMLWVVLALLGALLAMGSYLVVNGEVVELAGGSRVRLPFFFLNRALGYVAEPLNFPVRALAITMTALAVCAALVARAGSPRLALALAVLAGLDVQINQLTPWPMQRFAPTAFPGLTALAEGPTAPTADLSIIFRPDKESRWAALSAQMTHGQPIQAVPLERLEYFAQSGRTFVTALPLVKELTSIASQPITPLSSEYREDLWLLYDKGFRRVQLLGVGAEGRIPDAPRAALTTLLGPPMIDSANAVVWALPEVQATAEETSRWKTQQARREAALRGSVQTILGPQLQ